MTAQWYQFQIQSSDGESCGKRHANKTMEEKEVSTNQNIGRPMLEKRETTHVQEP